MLAEEVVFLRGGQRGVTVGRADHAKLVGVGAELFLELEAAPQRRAGILAGQHVVGLGLRGVEIADVPCLVISELVLGRQVGMGLAVAFDLRGLV